ncbi:MAG TPA: type II toxin-antitoxin system Phd/YefM family antitoxin [Longimicrobiaceae bacterium]|nr:type II toxin-antitoxin system Phd/YefM family antitoxin [Longimicrobiaceae bacterium]
MKTWKLEDAKNRFSEVVRLALAHEPQRVTRNGRESVVVVSADDYERLVSPQDLFTFLQSSPLAEAIAAGEFELPERPRDLGRDIDL